MKLVIGHQRRFLPAYTLARDLIAKGAIGKVNFMCEFRRAGPAELLVASDGHVPIPAGRLECRWVMGNVERKTDRFERTTRIEDRAICVYEFANGARR